MVMKENAPLSSRIAEEMQLLAEEKWIISALTQVRRERNAMQIERLELESAKAMLLKHMHDSSIAKFKTPAVTQSEPPPSPQTKTEEGSALEMMVTSQTASTLAELEDALPQDLVDDTFCNDMQLNLTVTNSIFNLDGNEMEEEEEVSEESDEESADSIFMDMNMFMNSNKNW